jgi:hypothetical protein
MADIEKAADVGRSCRSCSRTADGAEVGSGEGGKASQVGKSEVGKAWKRISQIRRSGAPLLQAQKKISKARLKPGLWAFPCRKPSQSLLQARDVGWAWTGSNGLGWAGLRALSPAQHITNPELLIDQIDNIIKVSMPVDNASLQGKIRKFMTHGRNHLTREISRCRKGNKCIYGFLHPITHTTWVDEDGRVHYKCLTEEDRWIAPHIPELIDELDCHIFVDIVFTVSVFTYLYKYLYKGPDHTLFNVSRMGQWNDETKDYVDARYLSTHEAAWRILGFHITSKNLSVSCLPVYLPDENIARTQAEELHQIPQHRFLFGI